MASLILTLNSLRTKTVNAAKTFNNGTTPKSYSDTPNYCPKKSEITTYSPDALIDGTYSNNLLVLDSAIYFATASWTTNVAFNDVPASGGTATVSTNPTISYVIAGTTYTTTYPNTSTYGDWSITSVTGSNLGTTEKSRTKIGTGSITFTAKAAYGGWTSTTSGDVYQLANSKTRVNDNKVYGTPGDPYSNGSITAAGGSFTQYVNCIGIDTLYYHYTYTSGSSEPNGSYSEVVDGIAIALINANFINNTNNSSSTSRYTLSGDMTNGFVLSHSSMGLNVGTDSCILKISNYGDSSKSFSKTFNPINQIDTIGVKFNLLWDNDNQDDYYVLGTNTFTGKRIYDANNSMGSGTGLLVDGRTHPDIAKLYTNLYYTSGSVIDGSNMETYVSWIDKSGAISLASGYHEFNLSFADNNWNFKCCSSSSGTSEVTWAKMHTDNSTSYFYYVSVLLGYNSGSLRSFYPKIAPKSDITISYNIKSEYRANNTAYTLSRTVSGYKRLNVIYKNNNDTLTGGTVLTQNTA